MSPPLRKAGFDQSPGPGSGALRVSFGGATAMGITYGIGYAFGSLVRDPTDPVSPSNPNHTTFRS